MVLEAVRLETSLSYGVEAERIARADQASELSYLAFTTAFFFRSVADQNQPPDINDSYLMRAQKLASVLARIAATQQTDERKLRYRELMPKRLWTRALKDDGNLAGLLQSIPALLEQLGQGQVHPTDLRRQADLLDEAAIRFRDELGEELGRLRR